MELSNEWYRKIIYYDLNKENLFKEFREKYIGIKKENFVGDFPTWSDFSITGLYSFKTESLSFISIS
jgi:hypothetical protein